MSPKHARPTSKYAYSVGCAIHVAFSALRARIMAKTHNTAAANASSISPTNPVTRFRPKHEEQCAGHYQREKCVIPIAARLRKRNHRPKYSPCAQEPEADVRW